tara:strand:- start:1405 stop:1533 length:129 start_codon:yes stop_codon:yes gene_type:complete
LDIFILSVRFLHNTGFWRDRFIFCGEQQRKSPNPREIRTPLR